MLAEVLGTALPDPGQAQLHSSWVTFPEFPQFPAFCVRRPDHMAACPKCTVFLGVTFSALSAFLTRIPFSHPLGLCSGSTGFSQRNTEVESG